MQKQNVKQEKICYSIKGIIEATDYSRSYIFESIRNNELKTFMRGNRRFTLHSDLVDFIHRQAGEV